MGKNGGEGSGWTKISALNMMTYRQVGQVIQIAEYVELNLGGPNSLLR